MRKVGKIIETKTGLKQKWKGHGKYFCLECLRASKDGSACASKDHLVFAVSHKVRFPSPKESVQRWKEFIKICGSYVLVSINSRLEETIGSFRKEILTSLKDKK